MKLLAQLLIVCGLFCYGLAMYYLWLQNDPNRLAFTEYKHEQKSSDSNKEYPQRVVIKNLDINLPLIPAQLNGNKWDVTNDGASYLTSSPIPGEKGNSIMYGHNWSVLFSNLVKAQKGDEIEVIYADQSVKKFVVESTATVSPDKKDILKQTEDKRLTLYTCTGFLDSQRFIVVAKLKDS